MTPAELLVVSISIGIVVSFLFSELYGLAAGGVVVPGYVALYLDRPMVLGMTLLVALASVLVAKVLGSFLIIYGRRRTAIMILVAFALGAWLTTLAPSTLFQGLPGSLQESEMRVIGFIIPGLIAIWFDRQGIGSTLAALTIASVVVRLVLLLLVGPLILEGVNNL